MEKSIYTPEYEYFCKVLKHLRKEKNVIQKDLGEKMGKMQSFIYKTENGERRLDMVEFLYYCKALDIDPHAVIDDVLEYMAQQDKLGS